MVTITQPAQIVILAGGLGTRLWPLTTEIPKAMILIQGKPFIDYQLQWLSRCGIHDVVLSIGYLGHLIRDYVQDGSRWNLRVRYSDESTQLRGTAGALRLCYDLGLLNDGFLVTYGDSFLPIDFKAVWNFYWTTGQTALMTVLQNQEKWDVSNVCFDGKSVTLYDKNVKGPKPDSMRYIDYGLSALSKELVDREIPRNEKSDLADLLHRLSQQGHLAGYEVHDRFYEIGSHSGIQDFESYLQRSPFHLQVSS